MNQIAEQVRSGTGVFRGDDGLYYIGLDDPNYERLRPKALPAIEFTRELHLLAQSFYARYDPQRAIDYEELAYLARQVTDAITSEHENPALLPLIDQLADAGPPNSGELARRASAAYDYIRDTVWRMLSGPIASVEHLAVITDGCRALGNVDLFTLNHDLVLEQALSEAGIAFVDGFARKHGELRIWSDSFGNAPVRLFKLHGSIGWWGFQIKGEDWRGWVTARAETDDVDHAKGPNSELVGVPHNMRPVFLIGTFDKAFDYETWVFPDQHFRLQEALRRTVQVVVIGYGFRDKAINARLIAWLSREPDNRLLIVHAKPDVLRGMARGAIYSNWDRWCRSGQLRVLRAWVADVTWADIAQQLD